MKYVFIGASFRLQQSPCPVCKHPLDGLTPATIDGPSTKVASGDYIPDRNSFSICVYCASMLRFVNERDLRKITPDDLVELLNSDPEVFNLLHKMANVANGLVRDRQRRNRQRN